MRLVIALAAACVMMSGCTTTRTQVALEATRPAPGARVVLIQPDVQLAMLTAAGVQEARADWSQAGRANLTRELETQLAAKAHGLKTLDPEAAMPGRSGQLLRLHEAVGQSVLAFNYGPMKLPTKKGFDWTLGDGAQVIGEQQGADYALFVRGQGTYASGGRVATMIGLSLLGVSVPLGQQQVFASLVDLKTGRVVWFNVAVAGPNADMREPAGASSLTTSLLKNIPL
jgi:hypothetical protein